jgi:hypothetical protein
VHALLSVFCLVVLATGAAAQQYSSDPIDKEATRNRFVVQSVARNPASYATEKEKFLGYFKGIHFPEMTQTEPVSLGKLGKSRSDLFKILWGTPNETLQGELTDLAFKEMKRIIVQTKPPYHPAVRYNAVLTIGLLDAQYAIESGANRRPPQPLPAANQILVQLIKLGAAGNTAVSPAMIAGALVGLERHARFRDGLPNEAVQSMVVEVLKIVTADRPAIEMGSDVHAWIRLRAASVLAELGAVGPDNQVYNALVQLLSSSKSLDDRCTTSVLLTKLQYEGATIDKQALADQLLKLAKDVAEAEVKRATDYQEEQLRGGGFLAGPAMPRRGELDFGGRGGGFAEEDEEKDDFPRSHVLARLSALKTALEKLKPIVPVETQAKFDAILAEINTGIATTADQDTVSLNVAAALLDMGNVVKGIAAPAGAVAADDADAFGSPEPAEEGADEAEEAEAAPTDEPAVDAPTAAEEPPVDAQPAEDPTDAAAPTPAAEAPAEAAPANGQ